MSENNLILTLDDFINLIKTGDWKHEQSIQEPNEDYKENPDYPFEDDDYGVDITDVPDDVDINDDIEIIEPYILTLWGYACIESTLELREGRSIDILYQEVFSYNPDKSRRDVGDDDRRAQRRMAVPFAWHQDH